MTQPLVTIMIASRHRFDRLKETMRSFLKTAKHEHLEFLIRLHKDLPEDWDRREELQALCPDVPVIVVGGRDLLPKEGIEVLYGEFVPLATGKWLWCWADDQIIVGGGWDDQLAAFPTEGVMVLTQYHQLNRSNYEQNAQQQGASPLIPNGALEKFGAKDPVTGVVNTQDYVMDNLFRVKLKWRVELLKGVKLFHDRRVDKTLPPEAY